MTYKKVINPRRDYQHIAITLVNDGAAQTKESTYRT